MTTSPSAGRLSDWIDAQARLPIGTCQAWYWSTKNVCGSFVLIIDRTAGSWLQWAPKVIAWLVRPSPLRHIAELSPLPTPAFDEHDLEAGALTFHPRLDVNRQRPQHNSLSNVDLGFFPPDLLGSRE